MSQKNFPKLSIKRLLVALDMTHSDELLMHYVQFLQDILPNAEHVVLYHNIWFDDPEKAEEILESIEKPLEEILYKKIERLAKEYLRGISYEIKITQINDSAEAIVHTQRKQKIDLTLFGKKVNYEGSGYLIERVLHEEIVSHLMVVPETAYHRIDHILVPIDFTKKSAQTLQAAIQMAEKTEAKISLQHVYAVPRVYFPYIPDNDIKMKAQEKSHAHWKRFQQKYLKGMDSPDMVFSFHSERSVSKVVYNHAIKLQVDMIAASSEISMVNSTLIQLLKHDMHFPLFIVNDKKSRIDL